MRLIIWLLATLAACSSASILDRRQLTGLRGGPVTKPNKIVDVKPRVKATAKRQLIRFGPYTLPAVNPDKPPPINPMGKTMDPNGFIISMTVNEGICKDCTVLAGKSDITFEDGRRIDIKDGAYLHHILVLNNQKKAGKFISFCPKDNSTAAALMPKTSPLGSEFLGAGVDEFITWYTNPDGKTPSGYYIGNDTFSLQSEVVNYLSKPQQVYLTLDIEYVDGKYGVDSLSTLVSVSGCGRSGSYFHKDSYSNVTSGAFEVLNNGTLINSRGHMHDGGVEMVLYLNGKEVCQSKALYGGHGGDGKMTTADGKTWETINKMTECASPIRVKEGDSITMSSIYDTKVHPLRESHGQKMEEMGLYIFSFIPDKDPVQK